MNKQTTEVDLAVTDEVEDDPEDEVSTVLLVPMSGYKVAEEPEVEPEVEACPVELDELVEAAQLNQLHHRHPQAVLLLEVTGGSRTGSARF
jgi:hypothetical protein